MLLCMIFIEILTEEESNMWELNLLVLKFVFHGVADPGEDLRFPVMDFSVGSSIDLSMYRSCEVSIPLGGQNLWALYLWSCSFQSSITMKLLGK